MKSKGNTKSNESKGGNALVVATPVVSSSSSRAVVRVQGKDVKVGNTNDWRGLVATFISTQDVKESSRALYTRTLSQYFVWMEESGNQNGQNVPSPLLLHGQWHCGETNTGSHYLLHSRHIECIDSHGKKEVDR